MWSKWKRNAEMRTRGLEADRDYIKQLHFALVDAVRDLQVRQDLLAKHAGMRFRKVTASTTTEPIPEREI